MKLLLLEQLEEFLEYFLDLALCHQLKSSLSFVQNQFYLLQIGNSDNFTKKSLEIAARLGI